MPERIDLVLLDMLMPVLDGWRFLEQFAFQPPVAAVLTHEWATSHGCTGFLRKPILADDLFSEVRRCLG